MNAHQAAVAAANRHFSKPQDRKYFLRQMGAEANFQDQTSPAGASGYAQIMPGTARAWHVANVHDPVEAYNAAAAHMASYLHAYGGSWAKALTAYNAGPGRVGGALPAETQAYIAKVLGGRGDAAAGSTSASGGGGHTTITRTPATTSTDTKGAIVDALLHSGPVKGSIHNDLLGHAVSLVQSGAYTHTTPGKVTTTTSGGPAPVNDTTPAGHGKIDHFDGKPVAGWIAQELRWARAHGWTGTVNSGYRSDAEQTAIYKRGVRPAAVPKSMGGAGSNHEGFVFPLGAVDVTNAPELASILAKNPHSRLVWAGAKDSVHFSHPHGGAY